MDLSAEHCQKGKTPRLSQSEIKNLLEKIPGWDLRRDRLARHVSFPDFVSSMSFVNRVAVLAEAEQHHPDIAIHWNKVDLELTTHDAGGLTRNDFIVAARINAL